MADFHFDETKIELSEDEGKQKLPNDAFHGLRKQETEPPYSNA